MCICINCRHIHRCQTYLIIKKKHQKNNQNIIEEKYIFNPMNNIISININIQSRNIILDWDLTECLSFIEKPGHWQRKNMLKNN